jgi:hypothetical protein
LFKTSADRDLFTGHTDFEGSKEVTHRAENGCFLHDNDLWGVYLLNVYAATGKRQLVKDSEDPSRGTALQ